jgi:hypothetical protein
MMISTETGITIDTDVSCLPAIWVLDASPAAIAEEEK